jgi:hypothetical protein
MLKQARRDGQALSTPDENRSPMVKGKPVKKRKLVNVDDAPIEIDFGSMMSS